MAFESMRVVGNERGRAIRMKTNQRVYLYSFNHFKKHINHGKSRVGKRDHPFKKENAELKNLLETFIQHYSIHFTDVVHTLSEKLHVSIKSFTGNFDAKAIKNSIYDAAGKSEKE